MNVNQAAFCTVTILGAATAASTIAAVTTAATVATIAYTILAVSLGGVSIAAITAWLDPDSITVRDYFDKMKEQTGIAVAGMVQFLAQVMVQSLIQGIGNGVARLISRKIAGDDVTISIAR